MGAQFVPERAADIQFTPVGAIAATNVQAALEELDAEKATAVSVFAWAVDWVNVQDYGAAGVVTETTLAATLNSGSSSATLTDASSYAIGHGMAIPGAGVAGAELVVILTGVAGNIVSWSGATSTTVASGTTVHHNDRQAFIDALATTKNVYVPVGNYNIIGANQSKIQMTNQGQWLCGGSVDMRMRTQSGPVIGTVLYSRSLTADCIQTVANNTRISDLVLAVDATLSASKTTGAGLVLGDISRSGLGVSLGSCFGAIIERLGISHHWDGLRVEYSTATFIHKVQIIAPHRYGIYGTSPAPTGGNYFLDINCYPLGYYGGAVAGIYIDQMDTTRWGNINCIGFPINFHLNATAGYINTQIFTGFTNEGATNIGIKLEGSASYKVRWCKFTGGEVLNGGVYVGTYVEDAGFTGMTVIAPANYLTTGRNGFSIYGTRTRIISVDVGSTDHPCTSYDGIHIYSGADKTEVIGTTSRMCRYGIAIDNGSTNNIVIGNTFEGQTAAYSLGSTARENSRIQGNIGLDDYGTSIAGTPGYVGQLALSGGAMYMAVGTSSSADWKQITA